MAGKDRGRIPHITRAIAACGPLAVLLAACGGGGGGSGSTTSTPPADTTATITKLTAVPNPTGLKFGFYEAETQQAATLPLLGRRTFARAGYEHWAASETKQGVYTFPSTPTCVSTHEFGEQLAASVAVSFTEALSFNPSTIPSFYPQDITDPTTRTAAKNYIYAYVQHMLKTVGSFTLTIDNEMVSNWQLEGTDTGQAQRAATWSAWYVEAAATARQAAADLNMSAQLKLQPIVNGDPFDAGNPIFAGAASNAWLVNAMAVSDSLGIDSYHSDPDQPVTDPTITINILKFWISNYSAGKPVMMTENGFDTITSIDPSVTRVQRQMKLTGTEQEQAEYYSGLLPALQAANAAGGAFGNQLRVFSIWSNIDNEHADNQDDVYFGLIRLDDSYKPSASVVAQAVEQYEADGFDSPFALTGPGADVTSGMAAGVALTFNDGDDFDFLRYTDTALPGGSQCHVRGTLASAGSLLVNVNGTWVQATLGAGAFDLRVNPLACRANGANQVDLYAPAAAFPATQTVSGMSLAMS